MHWGAAATIATERDRQAPAAHLGGGVRTALKMRPVEEQTLVGQQPAASGFGVQLREQARQQVLITDKPAVRARCRGTRDERNRRPTVFRRQERLGVASVR